MMCIAGYVCEPVCADHWADCNKDYRDGCETPSEDGRCAGDEARATDPLASIDCMRESSLSEPYDCDVFAAAEEAATAALAACYHRVLQAQPRAEDVVDYAVTVEPSGSVSTITKLGAESSNSALEDCARSAIQAVRLRNDGTARVAVTYPVRAVFVAHEL